jgi:hypothetical protein
MKMPEIMAAYRPLDAGSTVSCTTWPGRTFWMPSTIALSPSPRPDRTTTSVPSLGPVLTRLLAALANDGGHELTVGEIAFGVRDGRPHDQRIGLLVDLRIGEVPGAGMGIFLAVGQPQQDFDLVEPTALFPSGLADRFEIAHADGEQRIDRILADDRHQDTAGRIDQIADGIGCATDPAVDRRADVGVAEIGVGLLESGLGLHDPAGGRVQRRLVLIDDGLRAELPFGKFELPAVLEVGIGRCRLGDHEVCLGLIDQGLELHLFDLIQQVSGLHLLAFAEQDLFEKPLDARANLDLVHRLDVADEFERPAHALERHQPDADRGRRRRRSGRWRSRPRVPQHEPAHGDDGHRRRQPRNC